MIHKVQVYSKDVAVFCSECGTKCQNGDKFCFACGYKLKDLTKPAVPTTTLQQPAVSVEIVEEVEEVQVFKLPPEEEKRYSLMFFKKKDDRASKHSSVPDDEKDEKERKKLEKAEKEKQKQLEKLRKKEEKERLKQLEKEKKKLEKEKKQKKNDKGKDLPYRASELPDNRQQPLDPKRHTIDVVTAPQPIEPSGPPKLPPQVPTDVPKSEAPKVSTETQNEPPVPVPSGETKEKVSEKIKAFEQKKFEGSHSLNLPPKKSLNKSIFVPNPPSSDNLNNSDQTSSSDKLKQEERSTKQIARTNSFIIKHGIGMMSAETCPVCKQETTYKQDRVIIAGKEWHRKCWLQQTQEISSDSPVAQSPSTTPAAQSPSNIPPAASRKTSSSPSVSQNSSPMDKHAEKHSLVFHEAAKVVPKSTTTFGVPFRTILENEHSSNSIPRVVENCINHILEKCLHLEGIFRISPSSSQVASLCEQIDKGVNIDFAEITDPHVAPAILKKFLRELPDPLLTNELYTCFIAIWEIKDDQVKLNKLKDIIWLLPDENRQFLEYMLTFMAEVVASKDHNKMGLSNLVTIFGPLLLRSDVSNEDLLAESSTVCAIVAKMIENRTSLFVST